MGEGRRHGDGAGRGGERVRGGGDVQGRRRRRKEEKEEGDAGQHSPEARAARQEEDALVPGGYRAASSSRGLR